MSGPLGTPGFDLHAESYDADLNEALAVSGEDKQYFASRRVQWLARCLEKLGQSSADILDYGCGTGDTSGLLQSAFRARSVIGVDISLRSIEVAARRNGTDACRFMSYSDYSRLQSIDLAYCNGVFHHIPLDQRSSAMEYVYERLRPGGLFAFWENNPWNPGTRYVMAQCVFDHDAITIPPPEGRALLREQGFEILRTDYCFFFPRFLSALRFTESALSGLPLGAQYQILCRRPAR
jgi:SAM-dependent methyltransferase